MRLRIQKYIAQSGICSRRSAEDLIKQGLVLINGQEVAQIGQSVDPAIDQVSVKGQILKAKEEQYYIYHKPLRVLCSRKDPSLRTCLYDVIDPSLSHLRYAGRLDYMSEGLLILTNDGKFAHRLTHPTFEIHKTYHVWVPDFQYVNQFVRVVVAEGIHDAGELLRAKSARILTKGSGATLELVLGEGKNREIRRMIEAFGARVRRLVRLQMGPLQLGDLQPGRWRRFNQQEISFVQKLLNQ